MVFRGEPWILNRLEEVQWDYLDSCAEVCVSVVLIISTEAPNEAHFQLLTLRDYYTTNEFSPLNVLDCFWYDEALEDKKREKSSNFRMAVA